MRGWARGFLVALVAVAALVVAVCVEPAAAGVRAEPARAAAVAVLAGLLLFSPVTVNRRGRAATMTFGETAGVLVYAALPPPAAVLVLSLAAVVLSLALPSTPPNRLFNAASATVAAAVGGLVSAAGLQAGLPGPAAAAAAAFAMGTASHVHVLAVLGLARGGPPEGVLRDLPRLLVVEVLGVALGLALAPLVLGPPEDAWRLVPLVGVLALLGHRQRSLAAARDLLDALVRASHEVHASLDTHDVQATLRRHAERLLPEAAVALRPDPPGDGEVGALVAPGGGDEDPIWLVARAGVPQVDVPTETAVLEALAAPARSAVENARLHARLDEQARHDPLTGLANRHELTAHLTRELERCVRQGRALGLAFLDLDGFKAVNDRHGHQAGDALLRQVAGCLTASVRQSDLVARLAGDEFCVVLHDLEEGSDLEAVSSSLRALLDETARATGVGVSLGIALGPRDGDSCDVLMHAADERMYADKRRRAGRTSGAG